MTRSRLVVLIVAVLGSIVVAAPPAAAVNGSIAGTVTAANGGGGLHFVNVYIFNGNSFVDSTSTAVDGTYTVAGLAASLTGYSVCFDASSATGGSSTTGYADECYDDVAWNGSFQP